ncbi:succinylglutamate-semialdehyde dehydrogenase [Teredinibacter turnerae]|uniref:succinylglutamate-semialdehyde dehydrogenase n=1 Tax=Teredinibacter turnerae TaxID=2426 RepID=UPI000426D206|nr:succinylglutamate-semialdehyde dehydrogenase [Teredinibacter turnerae]
MHSVFIDGLWREGCGEPMCSIEPATGKTLWDGHSASTADIFQAVESAQVAFKSWRNIPLPERTSVVKRFSECLFSRQQELAEIISRETGKPHWESLQEVTAMINKVDISISAQRQRAGTTRDAQLALTHRPHGVMAVFGPYNFPGHLPNGHIVPALLAGNTVVFKPSEKTPYTAQKTLEIWAQAGLPAGVINLIQGDASVGKTLLDSDINGVLFTGSHATGVKIHRALAGHPEILLALELGGNNPLIVDEVANIDVAAWHVIRSAFISTGQRCTCARRLILIGNGAEQVLERVIQWVPKLAIGHWQDDPFFGPLIDTMAVQQVLKFQEKLIAAGGEVVLFAQPGEHAFISPGIVRINGSKTVFDDEVFGPLLQVYRAENFAQAVALANDTRFGLAAGLLSDNKAHQQIFLNESNAGVISINQPTAGASSKLPFGGTGHSGNHRPSALYAADYSAWPQSQMLGDDTAAQESNPPQGFSANI